MLLFRQILGYAGLIGFLAAGLGMLWHAFRLARLGHLNLLTNDLRFFARAQHAPEARPHVRGMWRWAAVAAAAFVLFAIGATAM